MSQIDNQSTKVDKSHEQLSTVFHGSIEDCCQLAKSEKLLDKVQLALVLHPDKEVHMALAYNPNINPLCAHIISENQNLLSTSKYSPYRMPNTEFFLEDFVTDYQNFFDILTEIAKEHPEWLIEIKTKDVTGYHYTSNDRISDIIYLPQTIIIPDEFILVIADYFAKFDFDVMANDRFFAGLMKRHSLSDVTKIELAKKNIRLRAETDQDEIRKNFKLNASLPLKVAMKQAEGYFSFLKY